jgi:hypothetical protein
MSRAALVERAAVRHILSMTQRRGGTTWAWLLASLVLGVACANGTANDIGTVSVVPPGYRLGGQTGSLVPDCGLAPLSAEGRSVPPGEALAVLYAGACPEPPSAEQLMLAGLGGGVAVELVPLETSGVYLVRADHTLASGDYQLDVGAGSPSELRVSDGELDPPRLGTLSQLPNATECAEQLGFELTLDDTALAYAPLSRFELSIDHGPAEVWVDYGALPIESRAEGSVGLLDLPRCGTERCLTPGQHRLQLTLSVAGANTQPAPLELAFAVQCSAAAEASAGPADAESGVSCAVAAPGCAARPGACAWFTCLVGVALCNARRRARARCGPPDNA